MAEWVIVGNLLYSMEIFAVHWMVATFNPEIVACHLLIILILNQFGTEAIPPSFGAIVP